MLFKSYVQYCALVITKIFEVSILNVILDQKLNFISHCALGLFKNTFVFKFNPSPPQIVRLVIETPHTKFQLIRSTREEGMQFEILNFRQKYGFCHL